MATIDDLTLATTNLLDAVTSGKAALDLAVDSTAANMYAVSADKDTVTVLTGQALSHKNAASVFATNASNSAVTANVRSYEAANSANLSEVAKDTAEAQAVISTTKAGEANVSKLAAEDAAAEAAASALTAFSSPTTQGHSITSMSMIAGMKTITIETGKYFVPGMSIQVAYSSNASAVWVHGVIESYVTGTGVLTFKIDLVNGSGTFADWVVSLSAPVGSDSINLTGLPTAPTATPGTNTTQIATTEFVTAAALATVTTIIEEGGTGGLDWTVETVSKTSAKGKAYLMDTSVAAKIVTLHSIPYVGDTVAIGDYAGSFGTNACTIARNGMMIDGVAADRVLNTNNEVASLVYSGTVKGWVTVASVTGDYPKTVLNKPFFHCQDQKAYNVDGGTSIADAWTARTLNTVISNDIQGASLSSNQVTLPAGTYYVEATSQLFQQTGYGVAVILGIAKDGVITLTGVQDNVYNSTMRPNVSGVVILSVPGVIDLRYYTGLAFTTTGLGASNNTGSITNPTIPSIYADLKIWQLDRSLEIAPKAINSGLQTIAGMNTEGGIMGADVTVSGNTLTITKGACMSSDLTTAMAVTVDTPVVLPGTINQDFYVCMVRLVAGGTFTYKAYTTLVGPSSDGLVDKWRLVSYAKNNGSGVTMPYIQTAERIDWTTSSKPILVSATTASFASYNIIAIPISLTKEYTCYSPTDKFAASYDGTNLVVGTLGFVEEISLIGVTPVYFKYFNGAQNVLCRSLTLRR